MLNATADATSTATAALSTGKVAHVWLQSCDCRREGGGGVVVVVAAAATVPAISDRVRKGFRSCHGSERALGIRESHGKITTCNRTVDSDRTVDRQKRKQFVSHMDVIG